MTKQPLIWQDYEYSHHEKNSEWYWTVWIIAISVSAISVIYGNVLFAGVLLVGTFALSVFAARAPSVVRYEINEKGISIDKTLYPFVTLEGFGIDSYAPEAPRLVIKSKKHIMSYFIIPLPVEIEEPVRKFLRYHLREGDYEEPLSQKIMEYLGF